ncbi:5794_t:CDS:2 [Cetraspora pellucida]|uniref:5794_t:CDS:1 n=1 Tax=Cetraspora pellucida TaxID=1433469 RepID=A0A9N8ZIE8_9GLOM|nr:5794_t:CDS:2 [Cetraspora pellucida]
MSSAEHYPGYSALRSFFNEHEHVNWSYYEFLTLNRDVIISLPSSTTDWNGLDGTWTPPISQCPDLGVSVNVLAQVMVVATLVSQRPDLRVDSERSKDGLKAYWENLKVKRTHILGSLDLLDEAGKHNVKDLFSGGLSNSFPVGMSSTAKHILECANVISPQENKKIKMGDQASVQEDTIQEDMLNSVIEASNIFKAVEFPEYYDKLKKYAVPTKTKYISKQAFKYMTLFDKIIDDYLWDDDDDGVVEKKFIETDDETISIMEKVVYSLDELTKKFNCLSHTLSIPTEQYEGFLYPDVHIIRSISST